MSEEKKDNIDYTNLSVEKTVELVKQGKVQLNRKSFNKAEDLFPQPDEEKNKNNKDKK